MYSQVLAVTKQGCPACEETKPGIQKAKKMIKKVRFKDVDVDTHPDIAATYGVTAFPEFVYTNRQGTVHKMPWKGVPTPQSIISWIDSIRGTSSSSNAPPAAAHNGDTRCTSCSKGGGVDPSIWGPPLWFVIHTTALSYPRTPTVRQKSEMQTFFRQLKDHLPCLYCQKHFAEELSRINSSVFNSRDSLFAWTVEFHNKVRARTHNETTPRHSVHYWKQHYKRQVYHFMQQHAGHQAQR